jgi:hypothetical protein
MENVFCDNLDVAPHGHHCFHSLLEQQSQTELLSIFCYLLHRLPMPVTYTYVVVHLDDYTPFVLVLPLQLNMMTIVHAMDALLAGLQLGYLFQCLILLRIYA